MSDVLARLTVALADRYRIERELGVGGMATVYLAEDLKHKRRVALKVLKPELAAVLGAERFVQEITTTAALQHPHILPLFDSGEADGFLYYVMPFIDGETLRAKLDRETQLGVDEAVRIASDVASALHYAHTNGVIHRDIKPENILLHDGRPMVADFGIALAVSAAAGGRMTETGLSLGTPHYMSPEQATAEKEITARSDVYSLGSVVYEMLSGNPPHTGASAQQIIMKIITTPAELVTVHRKSVPPNIAAAVATSLEKLPADRFESAKTFAEALQNRNYAATSQALAGAPPTMMRRAMLTSGAVAVAAIAVAAWALATRPAASSPDVLRVEVAMPDSLELFVNENFGSVALSRNGDFIVFRARRVIGGGSEPPSLWLRRRDNLVAERIPGTEGASVPSISTDGRHVAFGQRDLRGTRIAELGGGPPVPLSELEAFGDRVGFEASGAIVIASRAGYLARLQSAGAAVQRISTVDTIARNGRAREVRHTLPEVLPSGRGVLFTIQRQPTQAVDEYDVAVLDRASGEHKVLVRGVLARYHEGYLVVVRADGSIAAARFDERAMELDGSPVPVASGVRVGLFGSTNFDIDSRGTLLYVAGSSRTTPADLVWVTREGAISPAAPAWRANFDGAWISPDGRRIATAVNQQGKQDIWVAQATGGESRTKVTFNGIRNRRPGWFPGGERLTFVADDGIWTARADGVGASTRLFTEARSFAEGFVSRDGAWLVYRTSSGAAGAGDILAWRFSDSTTVPLAATVAGSDTRRFRGMADSSPTARRNRERTRLPCVPFRT